MNVAGANLGIPGGIAGWKILQARGARDFSGFARDPGLRSDIAYLKQALPGKLTAKSLLADRRLQQIVLTAYGLESQIGMDGLMEKVLNSDLSDTRSLARQLTNTAFRAIARDFNYAGSAVPARPAVESRTVLAVENLRPGGGSFGLFNGTLGGVQVRGLDLGGATDRFRLAAMLQAAFRKADGNRTDIAVRVDGTRLVFTDARGRGDLRDVTFAPTGGATATFVAKGLASAEAVAAPSLAEITLTGVKPGQTIGNFSGSFAGIAVDNIDLSAATTPQQVAAALQAAFRAADGDGGTAISVTAKGNVLTLRDARSRGGASDVSFATTPGGASAALTATTTDAGGALRPPSLPTPSRAEVLVTGLDTKHVATSFSGSFGGITLTDVDLSAATDRKMMAATLQAAFRAADKGRADISVTVEGQSLVFTDLQGNGGAQRFAFASKAGVTATVTQNSGPKPFTATHTGSTLAVSGLDAGHRLGRIGGTFAGVTIAPVDVSGAATLDDLAATLQGAFRAADRNRAFIKVAVSGSTLVLTDISGRGGATAFDITGPGAEGPSAAVVATSAGSQAVAASGGPAVGDPAFLARVVEKYTQAQFNSSVGDVSNTLRQALYARQTLPTVSNWYSVIADPNLATVVETALNLPASSFPAVPVDQQVAILKNRMDIADFKDPAKLSKLLDRFVTLAGAGETAAASPAVAQVAGLFGGGAAGSDGVTGATSAAIFAALYAR